MSRIFISNWNNFLGVLHKIETCFMNAFAMIVIRCHGDGCQINVGIQTKRTAWRNTSKTRVKLYISDNERL